MDEVLGDTDAGSLWYLNSKEQMLEVRIERVWKTMEGVFVEILPENAMHTTAVPVSDFLASYTRKEAIFPQGKLNAQDEGELQIGVGIENGKVLMAFAEPCSWIAMDAGMAEQIAKLILAKAELVRVGAN